MLAILDHHATRELRLDHPPVNALRAALLEALRAAVDSAPGDGVDALLVSGAPGYFSGGLDVPYLLTLPADQVLRTFRALVELMRALATSRIPVAAALTGHSPAGGAVLALFCDYRVMARGRYTIGLNEVQVGLEVPTLIHAALVRLVGVRQAERMLVEGRMLGPDEALRVGLIDELAEPDEVRRSALAWCERVLALPRAAMSETRKVARADLHHIAATARAVPEQFAAAWASEETQTAMRALCARLGKRRDQQ